MKEYGDSKEQLKEWVSPKKGSDTDEAENIGGKEEAEKTEYKPGEQIHPEDEEKLAEFEPWTHPSLEGAAP